MTCSFTWQPAGIYTNSSLGGEAQVLQAGNVRLSPPFVQRLGPFSAANSSWGCVTTQELAQVGSWRGWARPWGRTRVLGF
jgi:hypothetical protein